MSIKTILLHLANDPRHEMRLATAVALARRLQAHLRVLFVTSPIGMPAGAVGRGASQAFIVEATLVAEERAEAVRRETMATAQGLSVVWETLPGDHIELLAARANLADLAIVTQSHPEYLEDLVRLQLPDRLALQSACQTLVLPWEGKGFAEPESLLIGWKNARESGRAVRDALPFLKAAGEVTVATVGTAESETGGAGLVEYLARHGVTAAVRHVSADDDDAGAVLLQTAAELGSDALIMGAFGHSRLRELVLGGTTRHVLGNARLPVLLSH